jgi:predicted DNA-binding transcriptional regulator AlpA
MEKLLPPKKVGVILNKGRTTLYRMAISGELCPRKIRGRLGYLESEVEEFIKSLPVAGPKSDVETTDSPGGA